MNLVKTTQTNIVHLIKYVDDGRNSLNFVEDRKKSAFRPKRDWITADTMRATQKYHSAVKTMPKPQNMDLNLRDISQPNFNPSNTRITDISNTNLIE